MRGRSSLGPSPLSFRANPLNFRRRYAIGFALRASNVKSFVDINFQILWPTTYVRSRIRDLCGRRVTRSLRSGAAEYRLLRKCFTASTTEALSSWWECLKREVEIFVRSQYEEWPKQTNRIYCQHCLNTWRVPIEQTIEIVS